MREIKVILLLIALLCLVAFSQEVCDGDNCEERTNTDDETEFEVVDGDEEPIKDKHQLFPLSTKDIVATLFLSILVMVTNAVGIGGGGAIIPIILFFGFTVNTSVALSNVVVFVGALTRFLIKFNEAHPMKKAKIIDYSIVVLMLPAIMMGSFFGVQASVIFPEALVLILLGSLLLFISFKSSIKALEFYRKEAHSKEKVELHEILEGEDEDSESLDSEQEAQEIELERLDADNSWSDSVMYNSQDSLNTRALKNIKLSERSHFLTTKFAIICSCLTALVLTSMIRKGLVKDYFMDVERCSFEDVVVCLIFLVFCACSMCASIKLIIREYELKVIVDYPFVDGDIHWDANTMFIFTWFAVAGGFLASLVGLGGGIIYSPLMIEFGVNLKVAGATSMYMILLSALSATLQFIFMGVVPMEHAIFFSIVVVISTIFANLVLGVIISRSGKVSLLAVFLAGVIILCTLIVLFAASMQITEKLQNGEDVLSFGSYCE